MLSIRKKNSTSILNREEAEIKLWSIFRLEHFHELQWTAISAVLRGQRILLIEKTGYGKSLCYQFPALLFDGLTVVFSPLIALMRDQVNRLRELGLAAKCINSNQSWEDNLSTIQEAKEGLLKILYIAPERQENSLWLEEVRSMKLSMVVIDEAHCVSMWGHDFRPAYRRIVNLVNLLPKGLPVLATTATATRRVEIDIAKQLAGKIKVLRGNLLRENLKLYVIPVESDDDKLIWLGQNIPRLQGTGVIYTGTVTDTEVITHWLRKLHIQARAYNGRQDPATRIEVERGLLDNKWKCVVSTNALGMGIDKPDLRFIIHTQFPQSPVHYYQEIGRAGRDGLETVIILLYNHADRDLPESFIKGFKPATYKYDKVISLLRQDLLDEKEIMKAANLRQTQFRVIKADLIDQGIIREVTIGTTKRFEFVRKSKPFDPKIFDHVKKAKINDLQAMIDYAETTESRMKFLCNYLGDSTDREFRNCDNTSLPKHTIKNTPEWMKLLEEFHADNFPELETEHKGCNLVKGVAASLYGVTRVGTAIHHSKYENGGDFPNWLLQLLLKAYRQRYADSQFDMILYIPPTVSGDLVRHLAEKVSSILDIPVFHFLKKSRSTQEQKLFENTYLKSGNVAGAFTVDNPELLKEKRILLIDDIFDSGATIREAGKYLTRCKAKVIAPLVLAKTFRGDKP